jgi:sugar lactone lactonase YvrE
MKRSFLSTSAGLLLVLLFACTANTSDINEINEIANLSAKQNAHKAQVITIEEQDLFPEGIEYDKRNDRFLITSITRGNIGQVKDGVYSEWVSDDDLVATVGIHIDHSRKRVLVANASLESLAGLGAYDLDGNRIFYTDLGGLTAGANFANDVTVDQHGNAYVTDSFAGVIYKVDLQGNAVVFYENEELAPAPGGFGLNGIDYDPRGYLLVTKSDSGQLLKFPIDNPDDFTVVELPVTLNDPDGIYLKNPNQLVIVSNDFGGENASVQTFRTIDRWESASLIAEFHTGAVFPTTATVKRNDIYVLYGHLDVLLAGGSRAEFSIVKAE